MWSPNAVPVPQETEDRAAKVIVRVAKVTVPVAMETEVPAARASANRSARTEQTRNRQFPSAYMEKGGSNAAFFCVMGSFISLCAFL